jgi:hypothetical protein
MTQENIESVAQISKLLADGKKALEVLRAGYMETMKSMDEALGHLEVGLGQLAASLDDIGMCESVTNAWERGQLQ